MVSHEEISQRDSMVFKEELINAGKERGKDFELIHCELICCKGADVKLTMTS